MSPSMARAHREQPHAMMVLSAAERLARAGRPPMPTGICATLIALLALVAGACSADPRPHRFATTSELPDQPRRAPAVAVDPTPGLPRASRRATSEQSIAVLDTPADVEHARRVVRQFFRAVLDEEPEQLDSLITSDAWSRSTSLGANDRARPLWRARLARLDYAALSGQVIYRDTDIETYRQEDLRRLRGRRRLPLEASGDEVVVRVPISVTRAGPVRLFGDEIWFLLRPQHDGYRIVELVEDFRLP